MFIVVTDEGLLPDDGGSNSGSSSGDGDSNTFTPEGPLRKEPINFQINYQTTGAKQIRVSVENEWHKHEVPVCPSILVLDGSAPTFECETYEVSASVKAPDGSVGHGTSETDPYEVPRSVAANVAVTSNTKCNSNELESVCDWRVERMDNGVKYCCYNHWQLKKGCIYITY